MSSIRSYVLVVGEKASKLRVGGSVVRAVSLLHDYLTSDWSASPHVLYEIFLYMIEIDFWSLILERSLSILLVDRSIIVLIYCTFLFRLTILSPGYRQSDRGGKAS